MPATAVETASRVGTACACSAYRSSAEIGIMSATIRRSRRLIESCSGESSRRSSRATSRELVGVGVGADALGLVDAAAGDAERARLQLLAGAARVRDRTRR